MIKRKFPLLITFSIILVLGLLSGCASNNASTEGEASEDKIQLRMTWWGSQDRHDRTQKVIELYEEKNPNVEISAQFTGWDGYWNKLATQAAGGNLPDIIQMDYKFLSEYAENGLLENLNPYIKSGSLNFDDVEPLYLDGGKLDDNLYAVNIGANAHSVVYDPAMFEKAGVSVPEPGYTWTDLQKMGKELSDELGNGVYGLQPDAGIMMFKHYLRGNGKWLYNEDGSALGYEDDQLLVDFLQNTVDVLESGAASPPELFKSAGGNIEQMPIINEKTAIFTSAHSNQILAMEQAAGRPLELTIQPMLEGGEFGHYVKPGQFFSVTSQSEKAEEAAKFIDFVTNDLEANEILNAERGVPISSKVRDHLKPNLSDAGQKMFEYLELVEGYAREINQPDPPGATEIEDFFNTQIEDAIYYGEITPEEAAQMFRKKANEVLADNK
ncbi:sugar ABC transporter substrate-binding protein [Alkalihalobacillus macyae]|uniref:ABC transporter substrate-binding protein n=1 Tax=Guptibacillus hwajinpoensis TaxID=208199 RepID=UPI00273B6954|nr:sugar ABC transporter substrate-binding protein [Alkalihalobacillus macyae]MDP4551117.1 sugar ABC transporter substrate-binding protein [Alkalihalobacillus macyae]